MKQQLEKDIKELTTQIEALQAQAKPLQEKRAKLFNELRLESLKEILPLNPQKIVNSNYQTFDFDEGYKELKKFMAQFKFISCDGFWSHTQRKAMKIAFDQNQDFNIQKNEVTQFLEVMPYDDFDPKKQIETSINLHKVKVFSIFEYTLSEGGVFNLVVDELNQAALIKTVYGRGRVVKTLPVDEMLLYTYQNHPYQKKEEG